MLKTTPECLARYAQFCSETIMADAEFIGLVDPYMLRIKGVTDLFLGEEESGALCYVNCGDARVSMWPKPMAEELCVQFNMNMLRRGICVSLEAISRGSAISQVINLAKGLQAVANGDHMRKSMTGEMVESMETIHESADYEHWFKYHWAGQACRRRGDPKIQSWSIRKPSNAQAFEEGWEHEDQLLKAGA